MVFNFNCTFCRSLMFLGLLIPGRLACVEDPVAPSLVCAMLRSSTRPLGAFACAEPVPQSTKLVQASLVVQP
jgi:hypothetical protein